MVKGQTIQQLTIKLIFLMSFIVSVSFINAVVHASGSVLYDLKITEIYPNALNTNPGGGSQTGFEFVELANFSAETINLSEYRIHIKDKTKSMPLSGLIEPGEYKAIITTFALVDSGETVQLIHTVPSLQVLEEVTYGNTPTKEKSWSYFEYGWELGPITKNAPNIREVVEVPEIPEIPTVPDPSTIDVCPLTPDIDTSVPEGYTINAIGECELISPAPTQHCFVEISEISAHPIYNGNEYIEVVNNSSQTVNMSLCRLKINQGTEKILPNLLLVPQEYHLLTFSSGSIRNSAGTVTLTHSNNQNLEYSYPTTSSGQVINFETDSLLGVVSNIPTPGSANPIDIPTSENDPGMGGGPGLADCGPGKYRNPDTNRCRNIQTQTSTLVPCASDQERNPETNRCRKIASAGANLVPCAPDQERNPATNRCRKITSANASLVPCKPGQERNPDTNRCRKIGGSASTLKPCAVGQERNPETNRCRKIASAVDGTVLAANAAPAAIDEFQFKTQIILFLIVALVGYGLYEYRTDIKNFAEKIFSHGVRGRPPD